ncbi:MAG: hypothetical protein OXC27_06535 [Caldilineaceae bacterium]|nr:hypothetical protein [Caldilineaceae bacterium]
MRRSSSPEGTRIEKRSLCGFVCFTLRVSPLRAISHAEGVLNSGIGEDGTKSPDGRVATDGQRYDSQSTVTGGNRI